MAESHLCECGCGRETPIAKQTRRAAGAVKGQPTRFMAGHSSRFPKPPPLPSSILTPSWHAWLKRTRLASENTLATYERCLRRLEHHSGHVRDELRLAHVQDLLLDQSMSQRTREIIFVSYRLFHRWGALQGHWPLDPHLVEMRFPKARHSMQPALSLEEARGLLAGIRTPVEVRLVYLGLYAGFRLASMVDLDETGWQGSVISVRVKGGWMHRLPAHPLLMERRDEILSQPVGRRALQNACRRLRVHASGQPFTPKWLRRTFAERMAECGVEREVLGAVMGHSTSSVTVAHYAPVRWTEMVAAVKMLNWDDGGEQK